MKNTKPKVAQLSTAMKAPDDPTRTSTMSLSDDRGGLLEAPTDPEMKIRNPGGKQVGFGPSGLINS